jgi:hypothetical protein
MSTSLESGAGHSNLASQVNRAGLVTSCILRIEQDSDGQGTIIVREIC